MAYYKFGDTFRWFIARAVDIKDPEQLGRVKIRVIHEQTGELGKKKKSYGLTDDDLLWAWPISSIQSASLHWKKVKELENYEVPDWIDAVGLSPTGIAIGTYVFGFYLDGHEQNIPMIFGTYHKKSIYPEPPSSGGSMMQSAPPEEDEELNDVAKLARGEQTLPKTYEEGHRSLVKEPETSYEAEYPYNTTYTTKSGHCVEFDDTPGKERIHIWHKKGSYVEINKDGQVVAKTVDDDYEVVVKDKNLLVKGDWKVEVDGAATVYVQGNANIDVKGEMRIHSDGKMTINSNTAIDMDAPRIDLN